MLISRKIDTAGTNFTRPLVVTVATNLNSGSEAVAGKGLLGSINFRTSVPCSICSPEGVSMQLLGEKNALFPEGFPCNASVLDHADTFDYGGSFGSWTSFDGTLNGSYSQEEVSMMGSCYEVSSEIRLTVATRSLTCKTFRHPSTID